MTANDFFIGFRANENIGIPVLIQVTKQQRIKNILAIPWRDIAKYLSNAGGSYRRDAISSYSKRFGDILLCNIPSFYSIDAVLKYYKKDTEQCKDYWVGWFNPYSQKFDSVTNIQGQPILDAKDAIHNAETLYVSKYFESDSKYFVNNLEKTPPFRFPFCADDYSFPYLKFPTSIKHQCDMIVKEFYNWTNLFVDNSKLTEIIMLRDIHLFIMAAYKLSSEQRKWHAWDIFRKNSIMAFRGILHRLGGDIQTSISTVVTKNVFSSNHLNSNHVKVYTEQLYKYIAMSIAFFSISIDLKHRAECGQLLNVTLPYYHTSSGFRDDSFKELIPEPIEDAICQLQCAHPGLYPSAKFNDLRNFALALLYYYEHSPYLCFDSEILGCQTEANIISKNTKQVKAKVNKYIECT